MRGMFKILIGQSFFAGAVLYLCPDGAARRVLKLLSMAIFTATVLSPIKTIDYNQLSFEETRFTLAETEISRRAGQTSETLKKMMLQDNIKNYIERRGKELGLNIQSAAIELAQDEGGQWLPEAVEIEAAGENAAARELSYMLNDELGIPTERQAWILHG